MRHVLTAEGDDVLGRGLHARLGYHKGFGHLSPALVRDSDHGDFLHGGMSVNGVFHLDGRNVLTAADDDVLFAIAQLYIPVRVHHRQVPAVEPATPEGLSRRLRLVVIPAHDIVTAHDYLAQSLGVGWHVLHSVIDHAHLFSDDIRHALTGFFARARVRWERIPLLVPGTDTVRAVGLREAV